MSRSIGDRGEMKRTKRHLDAQIDRLLAGDDAPELGDGIADLVVRLRSEQAAGDPSTDLVVTLAAEARESESVPVRARTRTATPLTPKWRRRIMLSTFLSSLAGKLAIGSVALATTTGGLAATGNLPDPAQDWAAERLGAVGIEIPASDEVETVDRSDEVLDVVQGTDPDDRDQEFGEDVADAASDGESTEGLDKADDGAENAGDNTDVADEVTEDPEGAADEYTDEVPEDVPTDGDDVELPEETDTDADDVEVPEESDAGDDYRP